ncbi:MAG: hypothetical protein GEV13_33745 [Rhodospirillales bacterium]|nr:hypothetical protein [Rhodospirillales bacterium]
MQIEVAGQFLPIRPGLASAIEEAWTRLASPGTWWSGAERMAIAAEARNARGCKLCEERKQTLSPYAVTGVHESLRNLPDETAEAVHRLVTDASRITEAWVRTMADGPLGEAGYVEIVSVASIVTALDTFDRALGRMPRALPAAVDGPPSRRRPSGAKRNLAWVATLAPQDVAPGDPNPYPLHGDKNIHRALSLVPQAVIDFFDLDVELYLRDHEIRDFTTEYRAISHAQIELIAGRASAINRCFY